MVSPSLSFFHAIEFVGFYLPPLLFWAALMLLPFLLLRWALERLGFYKLVWHRPLFNLALYVLLLGGAVLLGNTSWL